MLLNISSVCIDTSICLWPDWPLSGPNRCVHYDGQEGVEDRLNAQCSELANNTTGA